MRLLVIASLLGVLSAAAGCFSDASSSTASAAAGSSGEASESSTETSEDGSTSSELDCAGTPGGNAVEDECGVCEGPGGPCVGCTNPAASNFAPLATLDDGSCTCTAAGGGEPDQAVEDWDSAGGSADQWQSFTAGASGGLVRVDLAVSSPLGETAGSGMLRIYEGEGTGGAELSAMEVVYTPNLGDFQQFSLEPPVVLAQGSVYTIRFSASEMNIGWVRYMNSDAYAGGRGSLGEDIDYAFRTLVAPCAPGT